MLIEFYIKNFSSLISSWDFFLCSPLFSRYIPAAFPNMEYHLIFTQGKEKKEGIVFFLFWEGGGVNVALFSVPFFVIPSKPIPMHWLSLLDLNNRYFLKLQTEEKKINSQNVKLMKEKCYKKTCNFKQLQINSVWFVIISVVRLSSTSVILLGPFCIIKY